MKETIEEYVTLKKGVCVDDAVEKVAAGGNAYIFPAQFDEGTVTAAVKGQHAGAEQLGHREKDQKIEEVHQQLETEAFLQAFPVPGTVKLGGIDVDTGVDTKSHRTQQVIQLGGNRHRTNAAHVADHDGVHEAGALVQDLLQGQRQCNTADFLVKRCWSNIFFFPTQTHKASPFFIIRS